MPNRMKPASTFRSSIGWTNRWDRISGANNRAFFDHWCSLSARTHSRSVADLRVMRPSSRTSLNRPAGATAKASAAAAQTTRSADESPT